MNLERTDRQAYELLHERVKGCAVQPGEPSISVAQYDAARRDYLAETGQTSTAGVNVWPPTSQTIRAHLGGGSWAAAMKALGLSVNAGRAAGSSTFSGADYARTMRDFATAVRAGDVPSDSFSAFAAWVKAQKADGARHPSPAAVRQHYGSWERAKSGMTRQG